MVMKEQSFSLETHPHTSSNPDPDEDLSITTSHKVESLSLAPAIKDAPWLCDARRLPKTFETEETFLFVFPLCDHLQVVEPSGFSITVTSGEVLFVPSFTHIKVSSSTGGGQFLVLHFGPSIQLCNGICPRSCADNYHGSAKSDEKDDSFRKKNSILVTSLPLKEIAIYWRHSLYETVRTGIRSLSFFEFKLRELFFIFREFYSREEVEDFLRLFHCSNYGFRAFVYRHHWDCKSVEELADLAGLSLSTFKRIFKEEFRTSPLRWINGQKATYLLRDLEDSDIPLADLAIKYNFSSVSYLCAFSRKMLGATPYTIRQNREKPN